MYHSEEAIHEIFPQIAETNNGDQAANQLIATILTLVVSILSGIATGYLVKLPIFAPYEEKDPLFCDSKEFNVPATFTGGKTYEERIDALFEKCNMISGS